MAQGKAKGLEFEKALQELEGLVDGAPLGRRDLETEQVKQRFQPLGGPGALVGRVDMRQGVEREVLVALAGDRVVVAAGGLGERHRRVALVEDEHLGVRVAKPLGLEEAQERRFPGTGGADDECVADV